MGYYGHLHLLHELLRAGNGLIFLKQQIFLDVSELSFSEV